MPVRSIRAIVAGPAFKEQHQAITEFWRRLTEQNGGREGDPHDRAEITDCYFDEHRGWVIEYDIKVDDERPPEPEPFEVPLNIKRSEPVYKEPPEGRAAHAEKLMGQVDALVAKHKKDAEHFKELLDPAPPVFESIDKEQPIPVKDVLITGWNPRKAFDPEALQALADDIREHGLINAVTVRPKGKSKYELVAGERRLRAFRLLGRVTIPAKVRELTDEQVLDIMLAENLQRVDLNPIEEAHHLKRVLEMNKGLTQTDLGKRIGKSQEWVSQRLRLAEAPPGLQDAIIRRRINPTAATDLLAWKDTDHFGLLMNRVDSGIQEEISAGGLGVTVRQVREIIKEVTEPEPESDAQYLVRTLAESVDPEPEALSQNPDEAEVDGTGNGPGDEGDYLSGEPEPLEKAYIARVEAAKAGADGVACWKCNVCHDTLCKVTTNRAGDISAMLVHIGTSVGIGSSKGRREEHLAALQRLSRSIADGGDTWGLLQKLFHQGRPEDP